MEPGEPARETNPPAESAGITRLPLPSTPPGGAPPIRNKRGRGQGKAGEGKAGGRERGTPQSRLDQSIGQGWKVGTSGTVTVVAEFQQLGTKKEGLRSAFASMLSPPPAPISLWDVLYPYVQVHAFLSFCSRGLSFSSSSPPPLLGLRRVPSPLRWDGAQPGGLPESRSPWWLTFFGDGAKKELASETFLSNIWPPRSFPISRFPNPSLRPPLSSSTGRISKGMRFFLAKM